MSSTLIKVLSHTVEHSEVRLKVNPREELVDQVVVEEMAERVATRVVTKAAVITKAVVEAEDNSKEVVVMDHQVPFHLACSITPHIHPKIGKEQSIIFSVVASLHRSMNEN